METIMSRVRGPPAIPWQELNQPVPLVKVIAQPIQQGSSTVRYVATGITNEAEAILSQLKAPLYICAFAGIGRSGKSYTATNMRTQIVGDSKHQFISAPGNVPVTHGIDMMVFENPRGEGTVIILDCEGGSNHNQTALPFVMGLAARLASRMYVFERGCFTTGGLDTLMQVINMGHATLSQDAIQITKSVVLVENMSMNLDIPEADLLRDLLNDENGDETTNRVRTLVKDRFKLEFVKLPLNRRGDEDLYKEVCAEMCDLMLDAFSPFEVSSVPVDGQFVIKLVNELVSQIRGGGNKFNMVTATEALVSNMASEAANTVWIEFVEKVKKAGNHPVQITGRKHLKTIMRQVEGCANESQVELDSFISRLEPAEAAATGRKIWERNYHNFETDIRSAYQRKTDELAKYSQWTDKINRWVRELVIYIIAAIRQFIRFARFSTALILMSNYYIWKNGFFLLTSMASGAVSGVFA